MPETDLTMLGLGAMGSALAATALASGRSLTLWNRTPGRVSPALAGADEAASVFAAVTASPLVVACLLDHASVHETLDPVAGDLRGRALVNLTTTTPNQAREVAAWATEHGIAYLDGAIMAVPSMIGSREAAILYSGPRAVFDRHRDLLDLWATSTYDGEDAGMASLFDLAMLSGMYTMFAGFLHGAAMVGSAGVSAKEYAARATPFLSAMTESFAGFAEVVDGGDHTVPGQQSLEFSDLGDILRASREQGIDPAPPAMVQALIGRQVAAGHGAEGFTRIIESLRTDGTDGTDTARTEAAR
jgi:3-hydroxyisobutyrate dehydrogenase-like beta-hydroxyacid dehydrogenase